MTSPPLLFHFSHIRKASCLVLSFRPSPNPLDMKCAKAPFVMNFSSPSFAQPAPADRQRCDEGGNRVRWVFKVWLATHHLDESKSMTTTSPVPFVWHPRAFTAILLRGVSDAELCTSLPSHSRLLAQQQKENFSSRFSHVLKYFSCIIHRKFFPFHCFPIAKLCNSFSFALLTVAHHFSLAP